MNFHKKCVFCILYLKLVKPKHMSVKLYFVSENTGPPILKVLNHIEVPDGDIRTVDYNNFYISGPDTPTENLFLSILDLPANGDLIKVSQGHDLVMKVGDNVTVSEVMDGKLRFRHHVGYVDKGM